MKTLTFRQELRDFFHFLRRPRLAPRFPQQDLGPGRLTDWSNGLGVKRILQWALFLWIVNLTIFGPVAASIATSTGAEHRLNLQNLPWKQAILWAPIIEELVFRYVLRRPSQSLWLLPIAVWCMFQGASTLTVLLAVALVIVLAWQPVRQLWPSAFFLRVLLGIGWPKRWLRFYSRHFVWFFYGLTALFASLHLYNFNFDRSALMLLPLLILPQFVTGLVLAWLRVRRGIGASIVLHAVFNTGPLLLIMLIMTLFSDAML